MYVLIILKGNMNTIFVYTFICPNKCIVYIKYIVSYNSENFKSVEFFLSI